VKEPRLCKWCGGVNTVAKSRFCAERCREDAKRERLDARNEKRRSERVTVLFTALQAKGYVPSKSYENTLIRKGDITKYDCRRFRSRTVELARQLGVWPSAVVA
jgi:hypothetical protein